MKHRMAKLRTVSLEAQDDVKETFDELEEKYYEAERRAQDFEMKVWHLEQEQNLKTNVAPPTDQGDEYDYVDPNDFSEGPYRGVDEEEEEEDVPRSPPRPNLSRNLRLRYQLSIRKRALLVRVTPHRRSVLQQLRQNQIK